MYTILNHVTKKEGYKKHTRKLNNQTRKITSLGVSLIGFGEPHLIGYLTNITKPHRGRPNVHKQRPSDRAPSVRSHRAPPLFFFFPFFHLYFQHAHVDRGIVWLRTRFDEQSNFYFGFGCYPRLLIFWCWSCLGKDFSHLM